MTENRHGKVVTFYSYKGGTGRTMALANVAWILAANGKRVLVADWDLESPGLHRFFSPFIDSTRFAGTSGVIDLVREFEWATTRGAQQDPLWHLPFARTQKFSFSLSWRFPDEGTIDFLAAGQQNNNYAATLNGMDWDNFYEQLGGGQFLDALRDDMKHNYDYTLIDSRTGLSDVADICTIHLPDILVDCFTFSEQGIDGAATVARMVQQRYETRNIRILPVAMRVDPAEKLKADAGRTVAMQRFPGLPTNMTDKERDTYWAAMQVPYRAYYAYEETLATFGDSPGSTTSLLPAYERLTGHITGGEVETLPPMEEGVRARVNARFLRQPNAVEQEVTLRYAPTDHVWAEWIEHVLVSAGIRVNDPWTSGDDPAVASGRQLVVISNSNAKSESLIQPDSDGTRRPLAIYITDALPLANIPLSSSAHISGLSAAESAQRILALVGLPAGHVDPLSGTPGARFPGDPPQTQVFEAPARNARFTGREDDLRNLRGQLRARGTTVVLQGVNPVALQGMGGIGKTQIALEYVYRYRAAYDVVWWIPADPVAFIDVALTDLGAKLGMPAQATGPDTARAVLDALSHGLPYRRWLIVFDNADDPERVAQFLPEGGGHVLLTSRDPAWGDKAQPLEVNVFRSQESVEHLRRRVPDIRVDDALRVGVALGHLPIAVVAAGAWLADTGLPVSEYLPKIEQYGAEAVDRIWELSLERLKTRSPAAHRLLQICSVFAPEIALELVYSDEMGRALTPFDPSVADRLVRGSLVQHINRLALLKVDVKSGERSGTEERSLGNQRGQVLVHRLLARVVRNRMSEQEREETAHQVHKILVASRPSGEVDDPDTWDRFRTLWTHVEFTEALNCPVEAVRQLVIDRLRYLWIRGDLGRGEELAFRMEEAWTVLLASTEASPARSSLRRQLLQMRFHLANIHRDQGDFDASLALDEAVSAQQVDLLGAEHPHSLMTAGSLAADLRGLGRYPEALKRDEETYAAWLEFFGEDHPRTLSAMNNLAVSHRLMGDFKAARERDEWVYARLQLVLTPHHPNTLASASCLGRDLREAGEYERSIGLLTTISATFDRMWGAQSRGALNAQANLAVSLRTAGRAEEAARLLDLAYERLNDSLGPASPDTLACRLSRAVNLLSLEDYAQARRELDEVRDAYQRSLGDTHPHTLVCMNNLAAVARAVGDHTGARTLALSAAENLTRVLSSDHPYTLAAQVNLAVCTAEDGDLETALRPITDAAERLDRVLGPDHIDTLRGRANLALMLRELGSTGPDADETAILQVLAGRLGTNHPSIVALRDRRYLHRTIDPHPF